jgi:hypothetical protein
MAVENILAAACVSVGRLVNQKIVLTAALNCSNYLHASITRNLFAAIVAKEYRRFNRFRNTPHDRFDSVAA